MESQPPSLPPAPPQFRGIQIICNKCGSMITWPLADWEFQVIGVMQFRHAPCGQIVTVPFNAVWGIQEKIDQEELVGRLLVDNLLDKKDETGK